MPRIASHNGQRGQGSAHREWPHHTGTERKREIDQRLSRIRSMPVGFVFVNTMATDTTKYRRTRTAFSGGRSE